MVTEQLGRLNAKVAKEGLEPCDGKLSCPVLRGLGVSNDPRPPGERAPFWHTPHLVSALKYTMNSNAYQVANLA